MEDAIQKMSWERTWTGKRKKEDSNRLRSKPTIAFRSDLGPDILGYIKKLAAAKGKSRFINQAIGMRFFYLFNRKRFLSEVIRENYQQAKHILRKEGSRQKKNKGSKI